MRIIDTFNQGTLPVSFETFPPKGDLTMSEAYSMLGKLAQLNPSFVSVTYSAGGSGNSRATADIAALGQNDFGLTMMAHLTCAGATRETIAEAIASMKAKGIENVLALRGDLTPERQPIDYRFAKDLIPDLREAGFCVGAAAYPEGHIDCLDAAADIEYLKQKQDAGADFFVTQLFFDNDCALRFLERARAAQISVPITFGIMPFLSKSQITRMVFTCGASLPANIIKLLARYEDDEEALRSAGVEYACQQLIGLAEAGVDGVHVYCMNKPDVAAAAAAALAPYRA